MRLGACSGDARRRIGGRRDRAAEELRVHAMMVKNELNYIRLLHDLNIIKIHMPSYMTVSLVSPTEDHLHLFPFGDRLNVGCRLGVRCESHRAA